MSNYADDVGGFHVGWARRTHPDGALGDWLAVGTAATADEAEGLVLEWAREVGLGEVEVYVAPAGVRPEWGVHYERRAVTP